MHFNGRHTQHDPHGRSGHTFQGVKVLFLSAVPGNSHFAVGAHVEEIMTVWPALGWRVQPKAGQEPILRRISVPGHAGFCEGKIKMCDRTF